jgi:flagellar hook-basal body complex protein FliE
MNEKKKRKSAEIHIRCYPDDKKYAEDRARDNFGSGRNTLTNFVIYALRHIDDASPIDLSKAWELIETISRNRQVLAATHETIANIPQEINAIGKNVNQVAKAVNTVMLKARKNGETTAETVSKLLGYQNLIFSFMEDLSSAIDNYNDTFRQARTTVNAILRKEDEILTRCLVFPQVGPRHRRLSQLLRMLQDYQEESGFSDNQTLTILKDNLLLEISEAKENNI